MRGKLLTLILLLSSCYTIYAQSMTLVSSGFQNNQTIPVIYTCFGKNRMIPLRWYHVPKSSKSLALIMDDPDAPAGVWYHWMLYNIPPHPVKTQKQFEQVLKKVKIGFNSWGRRRYDGPCPPLGTHRYQITLYALDTHLWFADHPKPKQILSAIKKHIITKATLNGRVTHQKMKQKRPSRKKSLKSHSN